MKLTLAITTYNRTDMVLEAFRNIYHNPIIDEIVIVDDASTDENYKILEMLVTGFQRNEWLFKIKLFRNENNLGMSRNKREAVSKAKNEWVILFDSDNILYPEYLDSLWNELHTETKTRCGTIHGFSFENNVIYHPQVAEPDYDFSNLPSFIDSQNAKYLLHLKEFRVFANTCNYIVNRDEYLRVYEYDSSIQESDTIHFAHLWLKAGDGFKIIPGMKYFHRRHEGSGWLNGDHRYNMNKAAELQEKIKNL